MWHHRQWGVKALAAMGRRAEAIRYAEASRGLNDNPIAIARACEEILLSSGPADEAYARYAIEGNQGTTFLATFRSIAKKTRRRRRRGFSMTWSRAPLGRMKSGMHLTGQTGGW
jgi:hypothetical protein